MASAFDKLAETTIGATPATIDFQNISSAYRHLLVILSWRSAAAVVQDAVNVRFNNDASALYGYQRIYGNDVVVGADSYDNDVKGFIAQGAGASAPANEFAMVGLYILDYTSTNKFKGVVVSGGGFWGVAASQRILNAVAMRWKSTAAINRITIFTATAPTTFAQYTQATLYGLG